MSESQLEINVMDFGAFADGVHDDTDAIQRAVTAAHGGVVIFPPGVYRVGNGLAVQGTEEYKSAVKFDDQFFDNNDIIEVQL